MVGNIHKQKIFTSSGVFIDAVRRIRNYRLFFWFSIVYSSILVLILVLICVASHIGWSFDFVRSGSMEPELKTGSLAVTRPVDTGSIQIGDIITFHDNSPVPVSITHRVIKIWDNFPVYFQTKGDACGTMDPFSVPAKNVTGKMSFSLPYLGYIINFMKTPVGFFIPVGLLLILYLHRLAGELRYYRECKVKGIS